MEMLTKSPIGTEDAPSPVVSSSPTATSAPLTPQRLSTAGTRRSIDEVEGGTAENSSGITWKKIKLDTTADSNDNDSIASSGRVDNDEDGDGDSDDEEDDDGDDDEGEDDDDDDDDSSDNDSQFSSFSGLSDLSGQQWKPKMKPSLWIQKQMHSGANPRELLSQILSNGAVISQDLSDMTLWRILVNMLSEPPKRHKLRHINTMEDVIRLLHTCKNIMVLTGAGVSVSCGIPDFRSSDGIYSRLAKDFPSLPDPQAMFDINYFYRDPRPFFKFAREIYPGQFKPSTCHRFIKMLETKGKLLCNYTQNIDTLEQVAGIRNVIECHGSFATASCTKCKFKTTADTIREDIFAQRIPMCPKCKEARRSSEEKEDAEEGGGKAADATGGEWAYSGLVEKGIMKPDIVFFGEGLPETFHSSIAQDKDKCDLLIVIGSSLKVHPVALIPRSISPDVPQILINRERLGNFEFDVELLGDSDTIITQLCNLLGDDYSSLAADSTLLNESRQLKTSCKQLNTISRKSPSQVTVADDEDDGDDILSVNDDTTDSQSFKSIGGVASCSSFCDSGFESTSSFSNVVTASTSDASNTMLSNISDGLSNGRKYYHKHSHHHHRSASSHLKRRKEHSSSSESESPGFISPPPDTLLLNRLGGATTPSKSPVPADVLIGENSDPVAEGMLSTKQIDEIDRDSGGRGASGGIEEWRIAETSIAEQLPEGTYYRHVKPGIYIFSGAQVYLTPDLEISSCDDSDDEYDDNDRGAERNAGLIQHKESDDGVSLTTVVDQS